MTAIAARRRNRVRETGKDRVFNAVNLVFYNKLLNGLLIGNIQLLNVSIIIGMLRILFFQQLHFVS